MASTVHNRIRVASVGLTAIFMFVALFPSEARAENGSPQACKVIVVGYVGGLDTPGNPSSGIVQIRDRLRSLNHADLCVRTFSAYTWWHGYDWVRSKLPLGEDGKVSSVALSRAPKVIVYGHSFGGWASLSLSRRLQAINIPVELTMQIDSVGLTDKTVPPNVKESANYYRRALLPPYGNARIQAADPDRTRILPSVRVHANHIAVARAPEISDLVVGKVVALYEAPE
jgi:pimeloyl-ACP methyl ester carboxylesterase